MGAYLDSPKIDKDTSKITITKHFSYVATSMQGIHILKLPIKSYFYTIRMEIKYGGFSYYIF